MKKLFPQLSRVALLSLGVMFSACKEKPHGSNLVEVPNGASLEEIVSKSTEVVPTPQQYEWQKLEFISFVHFGPNTFTGVEWGTGKEDPKVFNPSHLDARQWVKVMKGAGMKMAMITAKHHDGFCLWPSRYTKHSVKSSPWKDGKGDVVGELAVACREADLKLGIYLSPADLHEIERPNGLYGNGSKARMVKIPSDPAQQKTAKKVLEYSLTDYDVYFMNQLYELLTEYGDIAEVWFDGANPKPGTGQVYNRKAWYDLIRQLQPNAVIAIKGPDVRWCGNEAGHTRTAEWSVLPISETPEGYDWLDKTKDDLGSRKMLKGARYLYWYPAETNTSIRHGWFYRDEKQGVKSVNQLLDIWYRSVGGNAVFLLNITPDRRGLIPEKDANNLTEMGRILEETFAHNLVEGGTVNASSIASSNTSAKYILDNDPSTYWMGEEGKEEAELEVVLPQKRDFNRFVIQEAIQYRGQRIETYAFDVWVNGAWKEVANGTTVGYKGILRFPTISTDRIRVRILNSRVCPSISDIGLYKAPELLSDPVITRDKEGRVTIKCETPDPAITYTTDGSEPTVKSSSYEGPFMFPRGGEIKAKAFVENFKRSSAVVEQSFDIAKTRWKIIETDMAVNGFSGSNAIDGNPKTMWHTPWNGDMGNHPHHIIVDLGEELNLKGFTYLPRSDGNTSGVVKRYAFYVSRDGKKWGKPVMQGAFDNIKNNPVLQEVFFKKATKGRFVKFVSLQEVTGKPWTTLAEIGMITR